MNTQAITRIVKLACITACVYLSAANAQDRPYCVFNEKCTKPITCPQPQPPPNCDAVTSANECNDMPQPTRYNCQTGSAKTCEISQVKTDQCVIAYDGEEARCGQNDSIWCQWDSNKNKCIRSSECCQGPCAYECRIVQ